MTGSKKDKTGQGVIDEDKARLERNKVLDKYELNHKESLILNATFDFPGITSEELSKIVGCGANWVRALRNTEKYKRAHKAMMMKPLEKLEAKLGMITDEYLKLCAQGVEPGVKERACKSVLKSFGILKEAPDGSSQFNGITIRHVDGSKTELTFGKQDEEEVEEE